MGAQMGRPEATVWGIDGDGCFQMTNQEPVTCALMGIPIKIAVMNNQSLGMVHQQRRHQDRSGSGSRLGGREPVGKHALSVLVGRPESRHWG